MGKISKKNKCKLPKYFVEEVMALEEVNQRVGWSITAFDLPDTWKITQGEGVKIAVLDTGCDLDHPDLVENLLPGINFINIGQRPEDDNQHGTHITGIIVAENNDIGMVGVAPKAKVIPIKVLDSNGSGDFGTVAKGIRWAVDNGADIISTSLGSPRPLLAIRKAVLYAESKGIPVFCAAGNAGNTREIFYPANYKETIAVGSIDENFDRSKFSCTGENLDFMAAGGKIFSTVPDNWYAFLSGTSMACPFAVGVAALCLAEKRKNGKNIVGAEAYRELFRQHVIALKNLDFSNKKFYQGFGIIDVKQLVTSVATN